MGPVCLINQDWFKHQSAPDCDKVLFVCLRVFLVSDFSERDTFFASAVYTEHVGLCSTPLTYTYLYYVFGKSQMQICPLFNLPTLWLANYSH